MTALELRTWRLSRNLSRRDLAALLGVSWRTIEHYEQGDRPIPQGRVAYINAMLAAKTCEDWLEFNPNSLGGKILLLAALAKSS